MHDRRLVGHGPKFLSLTPQRLLRLLALGDVPGEGAVVLAAAELQVIRSDFDGIDPPVPGLMDRLKNDALFLLEPASYRPTCSA